jgi:hypothetical protein
LKELRSVGIQSREGLKETHSDGIQSSEGLKELRSDGIQSSEGLKELRSDGIQSSYYMISIMKSRKMAWAIHLFLKRQLRNANKILV